MFNSIVLELPQEPQSLVLMGESGFGKIEYGSFNFWYLVSPKPDQNEIDETLKQVNKIKAKYLVVKSPKLATDRGTICRYRAKQLHEI